MVDCGVNNSHLKQVAKTPQCFIKIVVSCN